jgi:hypothetical protein
MSSVTQIVGRMKRNPKGVRFGNPRVNIQDDKGYAKAYQVRQVLTAIQRLEESNEPD